jgi:predicted N-acetyltransferase YhbS
MAVVIRLAACPAEVAGIKALQNANLASRLSEAERAAEGFVTAEYSLEFLLEMHRETPAVIATDDGVVVGYALVTTRELGAAHELVRSLVQAVDALEYRGLMLSTARYVLCGQLCVAKTHRGQGLAGALYAHFREALCADYDFLVTDVDTTNWRSSQAHLKAGFEVLATLGYGGAGWDVVIQDWR